MERMTENTMKSAETDDYQFHYINDNGIIVLCMADKLFVRKQAFAFLADVKKALIGYYTARDIQNAGQNGLAQFRSTLSEKMVRKSNINFCKGILQQQPSRL